MVQIKAFFDSATFTLTYVIWDPQTRDAIVIDPVLDYDPGTDSVSDASALEVISWLRRQDLRLYYLLETHAHADHLSGSQAIKEHYPQAKVAVGSRITEVQSAFKPLFDLPSSFPTDGSQFDRLLRDNEEVAAGSLQIKVLSTPGHTPACCSYLIEDAVFTGDALLMPDCGVGRCDFPEGSAGDLFDSVTERLYSLPDATRVFTGHDYLPDGRGLRFESTIDEQKQSNIHLKVGTSRNEFIRFRTERDQTLGAPKLLLPSIRINIDAGHLPPKDQDGHRYLGFTHSVTSVPLTTTDGEVS